MVFFTFVFRMHGVPPGDLHFIRINQWQKIYYTVRFVAGAAMR